MPDDDTQQPAPDPPSEAPEPLPSEPDPGLVVWVEKGADQDDVERR